MAALPNPADLSAASQIPVLSALPPEAFARVMAQARAINLRPGSRLFSQGEPATSLFVIVSGWIKLYRITPAGDEAVLNVFGAGESLAETAAFTPGSYPAMASAVTPTRLVVIPADHLVECICTMPELALAMIASASQHLNLMIGRVEQLSAQSGLQRVADFLSSLTASVSGPCTIPLPYDKALIAGRLGLKPESLSRVFAKLRTMGIFVRTSDVVVEDAATLLDLVAGDRIRMLAPSMPSQGSTRNIQVRWKAEANRKTTRNEGDSLQAAVK